DDTPTETQFAKDKGKGIFVEDPKPMKKKDQIAMDAERYHGYKKKPQSESQARKNMIDYLKNTEAQKAAKRRRLRKPAKEAKDLKKQLEVVADEDDDVFVEATPIGTKVPVVEKKYPLSRFTLEQLVNVAGLQKDTAARRKKLLVI
nr:hypothetical protein [Tanacetum cinerariifolium]